MMRIVGLLVLILAATTPDAQAQCVFAPELLAGLAAITPSTPARIVIAGADEPGARLVVTGRVVDGTKPIAGASIYIWHTDAKGFYAPGRNAGAGDLNPRLHGALRTDADGRYQYETVRPGSYLNIAAHVHHVIAAPGYKTRLFEVEFRDDPILVERREAGEPELPQSIRNSRCFKAQPDIVSIRPVRRDAAGVSHVVADIDVVPE